MTFKNDAANRPEGTIQEERDFLSDVLNSIDVLIVILDRHGYIVHFNRACERLFGYTADQFMSNLHTGRLPLPQEIGAIKNLLINLRGGKNTGEYENQWMTSDGELRTIAWSIALLQDGGGEVQYVIATGTDITLRKKAEGMLEREQLLLHSLISAIPDVISYKDRNGVYLGCNAAFERFRGCPAEQIIGRTDADLYPAPQAERFNQADQLVLTRGKSVSYESWMKTPSGKPVLIETHKTPYYGSDGETMGVIGIGRDITRHRMVENDLRNAKSEIEQLIASLSSILIVITPDYRITQWNPKAQEIFAIPAKEALGRSLGEVGIRWNWGQVLKSIEICKKERHPVYPDLFSFRRTNGEEGNLGVSVSPIIGDESGISGIILLCADITERIILENRLMQAQKLESIGQLAAGIAHEINTPIQYIGDNTTFLKESFQDLFVLLHRYEALFEAARAQDICQEQVAEIETLIHDSDVKYLFEEVPQAVQQSLDGIHRISEIVMAMKDFSHPGVKEKAHLDLNKALESTLTVSRNEWKYSAEIETHFCPDLPKVLCVPGEINQVLLNIVVNAAQAIASIPENGTAEKGIIKISTQHEGNWVEISIHDTGPGIPEEIQPHIFEPFFTTKDVGKGTGQGLAIAYDVVVRKHGGTLTFESRPGQGTTFIIRLPVDPAQVVIKQISPYLLKESKPGTNGAKE